MCFTIIDSGYVPRCALDCSDSGESRFHKILDLIVQYGMSIHDLSRVQIDGETRLRRFNMPLELGAALGLRIKGPARQRDRRLLILETQAHRYDITVYDLSGQDIAAHHDSEFEMIARVRDWLNAGRDGSAPLPGAAAIRTDHENDRLAVSSLIEAANLDPYPQPSHPDFLWTVYAAIEEMERQRTHRAP